jgi:LL-diaminopimelate aminotransferase
MATPATRRMMSIKLSPFDELAKRKGSAAARGIDVISLDVGSPDLPPPPQVAETLARAALNPAKYGYNSLARSRPLREAFAKMYDWQFGVTLDPDLHVLSLLGSNEAIAHAPHVLLEPGDIGLVPDPAFTSYAPTITVARGEVVRMPLLHENGWLPDFDAIPKDALRRAKLMWLNYPCNPTTATVTLAFFERAVEFCRQHGIMLLHDNAYCQCVWEDTPAPSVLQVPDALDVCVELVSLSKSHNMAGMRVGAIVGNPDLVRALTALKSDIDSGHFLGVQQAAVAALVDDTGWVAAQRRVYTLRRDIIVQGLRDMGFAVETPRATIYVWARLPEGSPDSQTWCVDRIERAGVAMMPGRAFGEHGEGYVRVSLVAAEDRLRQAIDRLRALT